MWIDIIYGFFFFFSLGESFYFTIKHSWWFAVIKTNLWLERLFVMHNNQKRNTVAQRPPRGWCNLLGVSVNITLCWKLYWKFKCEFLIILLCSEYAKEYWELESSPFLVTIRLKLKQINYISTINLIEKILTWTYSRKYFIL